MSNEILIDIPGRLKNKAVGGHVAGSSDIIDDNLQMTQAQINAIVLGDAIEVKLTGTPTVGLNGTQYTVNLVATCSTPATSITIKQDNIVIGTGSGTSFNKNQVITPSGSNIVFTAEFVIGILTKIAQFTFNAVYPIKYGYGAAYTDETAQANQASPRISPVGTYNINVGTATSYVFFLVPATMTINRATMGGFDFPLDTASNVTINGVAYKVYKSSNTYDAGDLTIIIS